MTNDIHWLSSAFVEMMPLQLLGICQCARGIAGIMAWTSGTTFLAGLRDSSDVSMPRWHFVCGPSFIRLCLITGMGNLRQLCRVELMRLMIVPPSGRQMNRRIMDIILY